MRAASDMTSLRFGSLASRNIASASMSGRWGGTIRPWHSSSTTSGTAPTRVATTGKPWARASSRAIGIPSLWLGCTDVRVQWLIVVATWRIPTCCDLGPVAPFCSVMFFGVSPQRYSHHVHIGELSCVVPAWLCFWSACVLRGAGTFRPYAHIRQCRLASLRRAASSAPHRVVGLSKLFATCVAS